MFDIIIHAFLILLGGGALLTGLIALGYGLYGMSVPGFDKTVMNFSIVIGTSLIAIVLGLYFSLGRTPEDPNPDKFVGIYESWDFNTLKVKLSKNGTFSASPGLFSKTTGKWQLIDFDEFYKIEFITPDNIRLKSLDILEGKDFIRLKTDHSVTDVEDQMELTKYDE